MARLLVRTAEFPLPEIHLKPGCNRLGREGENDFLVPHPSVSRQHCEVWLTDEALLVRDLKSRNGTFVNESPVTEAEILNNQVLRLGDIEFVVAEAPAHISVPDLPLPPPPPEQTYMPDGSPCCSIHAGIQAGVQCTNCQHVFCTTCVRELRVAGGLPRRFCPDCGGSCEPLAPVEHEKKRNWLLDKIVGAFTRPTRR